MRGILFHFLFYKLYLVYILGYFYHIVRVFKLTVVLSCYYYFPFDAFRRDKGTTLIDIEKEITVKKEIIVKIEKLLNLSKTCFYPYGVARDYS